MYPKIYNENLHFSRQYKVVRKHLDLNFLTVKFSSNGAFKQTKE